MKNPANKPQEKESTWVIRASLHYLEGINRGTITVQADSIEHAKDEATKRLKEHWPGVKRIDIDKVEKE